MFSYYLSNSAKHLTSNMKQRSSRYQVVDKYLTLARWEFDSCLQSDCQASDKQVPGTSHASTHQQIESSLVDSTSHGNQLILVCCVKTTIVQFIGESISNLLDYGNHKNYGNSNNSYLLADLTCRLDGDLIMFEKSKLI